MLLAFASLGSKKENTILPEFAFMQTTSSGLLSLSVAVDVRSTAIYPDDSDTYVIILFNFYLKKPAKAFSTLSAFLDIAKRM